MSHSLIDNVEAAPIVDRFSPVPVRDLAGGGSWAIDVHGQALKELIHEEFGDGITSGLYYDLLETCGHLAHCGVECT